MIKYNYNIRLDLLFQWGWFTLNRNLTELRIYLWGFRLGQPDFFSKPGTPQPKPIFFKGLLGPSFILTALSKVYNGGRETRIQMVFEWSLEKRSPLSC